MSDIIVVGCGAAGMMAAITAAERGASVLVIDKNEKPGRKLAITGKGRCNVTNNCDINGFMENVPRNGRFLYGAVTRFSPADTMAFFEELGVPLKTERGRRVFPVSDKAGDVVNALAERLSALNVKITRDNVRSLMTEDGRCVGVNGRNGQYRAGAVILAAGGCSYPKTGSDGYGYELARQAGHTIVEPRPSLVPLTTRETWVSEAAGLTLKNAGVRLVKDGRTVYDDLGELTFIGDGIGGAVTLSLSAHIEGDPRGYSVCIDLKPALTPEKLDARILRDFGELKSGVYGDCLRRLLPRELCGVYSALTGIPADRKIGGITKAERAKLLHTLKSLTLDIEGFHAIDEAIVTRGGVSVPEISAKTMESRLCPGLFLAGEIMDVDGYTGGFNLQIAFSTGRLAGISAAEKIL